MMAGILFIALYLHKMLESNAIEKHFPMEMVDEIQLDVDRLFADIGQLQEMDSSMEAILDWFS